jgi:hypothetical protein
VKLNGILECKFLLENADTVQQAQPHDANPNTAESMVETRTVRYSPPLPSARWRLVGRLFGEGDVSTGM